VKTGEEGMVGGEGEDPLLCHGALHIVVLDDHVLLQNLKTDTRVICKLSKKSSNETTSSICLAISVADPGCLSRILFLSITDPGSRIPDPTRAPKGERFCSHKYHKIVNYFIFEQVKKFF
jgi:hypothetical protein